MANTKFMTRTIDGRKLDFMFTFDKRDNVWSMACASIHNYKKVFNEYLAESECGYHVGRGDYCSFLEDVRHDSYYSAWWNEYVNPYDFDCCQMWDDDENNTCGENVWLFGFGDDVDYDFMNKVGNKGKELAKLC